MENNLRRINIITGKKDIGKSILCAKLVKELRNHNHLVSGILSPGKYENGKKVGIFAKDISTEDLIEFATYSPGWDPQNSRRIWKINGGAIQWGNEVLKRIDKCDVIIIDEIGFLELEKKDGWSYIFQLIKNNLCKLFLIVVRPELIDLALIYWEGAHVIEIKNTGQIDAVVGNIMHQTERILAI